MKKNLIIGAVVLILLLVGGFVFLKGGKKTAEAPAGENKTGQSVASKDDGNGLLDTAEKIKNAMLGGKKMECTFKQKGMGAGDKEVEMKMQSQGKKFRTAYTVANGETFVSVSDGDVIYSWSSKTTEGQKMDLKCMEDLSKGLPQVGDTAGDKIDYKAPEELVSEEPDMKCSPISAIDFSIPGDVKFTDTCAEMKKVFDSMKDLNVNLPQGVGFPAPTTE